MSSRDNRDRNHIDIDGNYNSDKSPIAEDRSPLTEVSNKPACLDECLTEGNSRWFQHHGELLFERSKIPEIAARLRTIAETDYEPVTSYEAQINPWKTTDFIGEVEERQRKVTDEYSFLTPTPTPTIEQKTNPGRAVISLDYSYGGPPIRNEKDWKRDHIIAVLNEFDCWVYHTKVIKPTVERFSINL